MRPGDIESPARRRYATRQSFQRFRMPTRLFRGSITCGLTIFARFACSDVNALAIMQLYFDGLVATVATYVKAHLVTAFFQFADDLIWDSALDFNVATFFHFFAGRFIVSLMLPA